MEWEEEFGWVVEPVINQRASLISSRSSMKPTNEPRNNSSLLTSPMHHYDFSIGPSLSLLYGELFVLYQPVQADRDR